MLFVSWQVITDSVGAKDCIFIFAILCQNSLSLLFVIALLHLEGNEDTNFPDIVKNLNFDEQTFLQETLSKLGKQSSDGQKYVLRNLCSGKISYTEGIFCFM